MDKSFLEEDLVFERYFSEEEVDKIEQALGITKTASDVQEKGNKSKICLRHLKRVHHRLHSCLFIHR